MHNLYSNFTKILSITQKFFFTKIVKDDNFQFYPRTPNLTDCQIIALSICSEILQIDSENLLYSKLKNDYSELFPNIGCRSTFNKRRRRLSPSISELFFLISDSLIDEFNGENTYIIDSMPLPICKRVRASRCKICKEDKDNLPDLGYSAFIKNGYFGYKLHMVISNQGVPYDFIISKASLHDINALTELVNIDIVGATVLGDKGYLSSDLKTSLFDDYDVKLLTPKRKNMKNAVVFTKKNRRDRKRIETFFSQLCDQFNIKKNYAKSFDGFATRIKAKVTAILLLQFINKQRHKPINRVKHALAF